VIPERIIFVSRGINVLRCITDTGFLTFADNVMASSSRIKMSKCHLRRLCSRKWDHYVVSKSLEPNSQQCSVTLQTDTSPRMLRKPQISLTLMLHVSFLF